MRHKIVVEVSILISDTKRYLSEGTHRIDLTEEEANYLRSELEYILEKIEDRKSRKT